MVYCLANPNSFQVLESLKDIKADIIVLSVLTPIYLQKLDWIENAVAVYGTSRDSFKAGFAVLSGSIKAEGRLPVSLD